MVKLLGKLVKGVLLVFGALVVLAIVIGLGSSGDSSDSSDFSSDQGKVEVQASSDKADGAADEEKESGAQTDQKPVEEESPKEKYTVTNEEADTSNPYSFAITGVLTNNTDRDLGYIQIEYILYDNEGNQIGTALDNLNNLKAGGTWKFSAMSMTSPDEVGSYELADVTGF